MAIKLKSLRANTAREEGGEWHYHTVEAEDGTREKIGVLVRGITYPPYQAAYSEALRAVAKKQESGEKITEEDRARLFGRPLARHILLGWTGLDEEFSPELAEECLCDPAFRFLRVLVEESASRTSRIDVALDREAAKN